MRILQPAEWTKPRGFSHGVELDGPGRWIVLAGQTGGDDKGEYQPDMAVQVGVALAPHHQAAGGGRRRSGAHRSPDLVPDQPRANTKPRAPASARPGARRWGEISRPRRCSTSHGLVDARAKVEIEVTAFVPGTGMPHMAIAGPIQRRADPVTAPSTAVADGVKTMRQIRNGSRLTKRNVKGPGRGGFRSNAFTAIRMARTALGKARELAR